MSSEPKVYTKLYDVLQDYPELQTYRDEMRRQVFARPYDKHKHEEAKAAYSAALEERGIVLDFGAPLGLGFSSVDEREVRSEREVRERSKTGISAVHRRTREQAARQRAEERP